MLTCATSSLGVIWNCLQVWDRFSSTLKSTTSTAVGGMAAPLVGDVVSFEETTGCPNSSTSTGFCRGCCLASHSPYASILFLMPRCLGTRPFFINELYRRARPGVDFLDWKVSIPSDWMVLCNLLASAQAFLTADDFLLVGII